MRNMPRSASKRAILRQRIEGLPKRAKVGLLAALALAAVIGVWTCSAAGTAGPAPPPAPAAVEPVKAEEEVPGAYLFQHFLAELHDCYRQTGHPIPLPELERQVGKEWGAAAAALAGYHRSGKCAERDHHLLIPGRAAWMIEQVQETAVTGGEEAAK